MILSFKPICMFEVNLSFKDFGCVFSKRSAITSTDKVSCNSSSKVSVFLSATSFVSFSKISVLEGPNISSCNSSKGCSKISSDFTSSLFSRTFSLFSSSETSSTISSLSSTKFKVTCSLELLIFSCISSTLASTSSDVLLIFASNASSTLFNNSSFVFSKFGVVFTNSSTNANIDNFSKTSLEISFKAKTSSLFFIFKIRCAKLIKSDSNFLCISCLLMLIFTGKYL